MLKNYIKIAFRNFQKNKTFTFLNIIGLTLAFGVALLLAMTAFFELSFDQFHQNKKNLYAVYTKDQTLKGSEISFSKPIPFANALKSEMPGVENISRYLTLNSLVASEGKQFTMETAFLDEDFFSMFSFPILKGNDKNPLKDISSAIISEKAAAKLFGDKKAIGKTMILLINGNKKTFVVSAVLKEIPQQSSLDFEVAVSFKNSPSYALNADRWDKSNHQVYLQLANEVSAFDFERNSHAFIVLHFQDDIENAKQDGAQPDENGHYKSLHLSSFGNIHFAKINNGKVEISKSYPLLVLGIALLILFIASVNFINMGVAKNTQRLREIGMRKTLGATKGQLFIQFWTESCIVFLGAMILGILLSVLLLDEFKNLFNTQASFANVTKPMFVVFLFLGFLIITLIAGGYPALLLSKLQTADALKGKLETSGKNRLRGALMVVQFGIAILLISGSLVLWSQLRFMRNKDLGFNKEQVIAFPLNGKSKNFMALFRNELRNKPGILSITAADDVLGIGKDGRVNTHEWGFYYKGRPVKTNYLVVDYDYVETLDLKMRSGRSFDRKFAVDSFSVLINEAMAKELGEKNPLDAQIDEDTLYSVIGVLKNYNFQSLNKKVAPITIFLSKDSNDLDYVYVKVAPENLMESFKIIKNTWEKLEPNIAFKASFLDENINRSFHREKTLATIITGGSIIAIVLSSIGLFAMSLMVVSQRTKEIGIRKIVGASVRSLVLLLILDFLKLVGIAFLIATPIAHWLLKDWLQNYPYRIDLSVWFFVLAGILAMLIALLSMGAKTIKAAMQNPVKSLRTE